MKKSFTGLMVLVLLLVVIALGFIFVYKKTDQPQPIIIQGEVEAHRVDISSRVSGRVAELNFDVGDVVKEGDEMLVLNSPSLLAQLYTAEQQLAVAKASRDYVYSTRPETIDAARAKLDEAQASLKLAEQSYNRVSTLSKSNATSKQSYDDALATYKVAQQNVTAAKANLELAVQGNSIEQKQLADAQVAQAQASLNQVVTDVKELKVIAPISGSVTARIAEKGQLYNANTPLFSVLNTQDMWFTFNIREDFLHDLKVGDQIEVMVPALNSKKFVLEVTTLNVLGSYANWQATKATGEFDLRTFALRAKPINGPIEGLRSGMTAVFTVYK